MYHILTYQKYCHIGAHLPINNSPSECIFTPLEHSDLTAVRLP